MNIDYKIQNRNETRLFMGIFEQGFEENEDIKLIFNREIDYKGQSLYETLYLDKKNKSYRFMWVPAYPHPLVHVDIAKHTVGHEEWARKKVQSSFDAYWAMFEYHKDSRKAIVALNQSATIVER